LAVLGQNLARTAAPLVQPWLAILAFVFNARWVLAECCVDPLRPPDKPGKRN
jgi:hypothetical protein